MAQLSLGDKASIATGKKMFWWQARRADRIDPQEWDPYPVRWIPHAASVPRTHLPAGDCTGNSEGVDDINFPGLCLQGVCTIFLGFLHARLKFRAFQTVHSVYVTPMAIPHSPRKH